MGITNEQKFRMMWISVDEELPKPMTWVLTYTIEAYTSKTFFVVNLLSEKGNWISDVYGDTKKITHWMPIFSPFEKNGGAI